MKRVVQSSSYWEGMVEAGCLCLKDGQRQPGKDRLTHMADLGEVITYVSLAREFLAVIHASRAN